ncbi:hypothetical protein GCM10009676_00560 [Prauserella halophila]|uniref:Antitoxin protein of toxin-antitoxin system n=1 Tax=Prauserella halophila TaxID=185641 RepID=A0ABN1VW20_9PSEU|nr:hypothetical protein [Prauserella halophila]MCP2234600.1 hypothetical protein [Prauserella halophila]
MASLFHKVARFAKSPAGKRAISEAKRMANDPHKRQQAKEAFDKIRKGSGGSRGDGRPPASR